jgi:hypothetical protein
MYRAGSLVTVAKEISKYKLDLVGVQEVTWDRGGTEPADEYTFFMERRMRIIKYVEAFCTYENYISSYESRVC